MVTKKKDLNKKEVREQIIDIEHNSRGRGRSDAEKRESYREYYARKRKVVEFERTNYEYLVLYPASDKDTNEKKFYNMGGHSAIIYAHEIGPRIGKKKVVLRHDLDHGKDDEKFRSGICTVANLDELERLLAKEGIRKVKTSDESIVIFKLKRQYPKDEIRAMLREEQQKMDILNATIYSKVLYPDIHAQIIKLNHLLPPKIKNMNREYRAVIGGYMMDALMRLNFAYTRMVHNTMVEVEAAEQMTVAADEILTLVSLFAELKLFEVVFSIRLADIVNKMKQIIKGKIINKKRGSDGASVDDVGERSEIAKKKAGQ